MAALRCLLLNFPPPPLPVAAAQWPVLGETPGWSEPICAEHHRSLPCGFWPVAANNPPVPQGTKALILDVRQGRRVVSGGSVLFPAGHYELQFSGTGGVYYQAPVPLVFRGLGAAPVHGGLFISGDTEHRQAFWDAEHGDQIFPLQKPVVLRTAP